MVYKAAVMCVVYMGILIGGYRMIVPLTNVWVTLLAVVGGGAVYGVLVLKLDRKIYEELRGIVMQINVS